MMPRPGLPAGRLLALLLAVLVTLPLVDGCAAKKGAAVMYHCPMHPTYVSDHPADCPICNMAMVPIVDTPEPSDRPVA